ncbi:hypothetical protein N7447_004159 [Penicillium robsamsonii]|uniref:uncharacterized protein n=1 Tax=Penicillium robsamsonii TaxID=1792511 RepID=UPI002547F906|nr:uncharacterized protein N7447_004159 [Penicillium robsamsonii]KAJ5827396.1 hypothetical protein N7447_004159 [Penicillium robsamsonii]
MYLLTVSKSDLFWLSYLLGFCADPTAYLYFIEYTLRQFCCANDTRGFREGSDNEEGCPSGVESLPVLDQHTLSYTATATTVSSTSAAVTNNANTDTSHSNTEAIAGGVGSGIAGAAILIALAWYLSRRRKKKNSEDDQCIQRAPVPVSELSDR